MGLLTARAIAVAVTTILMMPCAARADSYVCVSDMTTGFALRDNKWKQTNFLSKDTFVVKNEHSDNATRLYSVTETGKSYPSHRCTESRSEERFTGRIVCGGLGMAFIMDKNTLRFHELYLIGYLDGDDKPGNDPMISLGKCTKLD